ncbi:MAG: S1 RNA-binding domain-containing protein, partial [Chloroflexi bacterium]|nr:S1 RNA-binding domain-containing protein [Chloroflexota bacterium]
RSLGSDGWSKLSVGDEMLIYVLQPENQEGQVVLSLDRAAGEKGWRILQTRFEAGETIDAEVVGYNKGGLLVNIEGVRGFVPSSQVVGLRFEASNEGSQEARFAQWIGRELKLKIIEINRRRNRLILSERAALQELRSMQKEKLLAELREGEIRRGKVTSIRNFGVFIDLGGAEGLIHLSELSWGRVKTPEEVVRVGDDVDVFVMSVDPESKKIALSLRRAQPEAWEGIIDKYQVGQTVQGTITKLTNFGAFAHIEGPVEGLIHVSELADRRILHPKEVVKEGDVLSLKIVRIERERHRLGLSLKQALDEAEGLEQDDVRRQVDAFNRPRGEGARTLGDVADPDMLAALREVGRGTDETVRARRDESDDEARYSPELVDDRRRPGMGRRMGSGRSP